MNAQNDFWIGLAGALAALAFVFAQRRKVLRCSEGTERMAHIAAAIRKGANAYLRRQYSTVARIFVVVLPCCSFWRPSASWKAGSSPLPS